MSESEIKTIFKCWNLIVNKELIYLFVDIIMVLIMTKLILDDNFNFGIGVDLIKFQLVKGIPFIIYKMIMRNKVKEIIIK